MKVKKGDKVQFIREGSMVEGVVKEVKDCSPDMWYLIDDKCKDSWIFGGHLILLTPLPVIPKLAADAINTFKENEYDLAVAINYETYTDELVKELSLDRKMRGWLWETSNQELFARAWIEGYEIEKEPLYYVRFIPGNSVSYLNLRWVDKGLILNSCGQDDIYKTKFTEKEIKNMNINYWAFRVPVEDLEETK
ncbi:TPA_asm: DUF1642 domain-containing protein [Listeria monocytogenes]|uniref:DUF1642 domain-containing protein n=1 Tax=Listeria seeligeri TaxID=1640 RepID=UPI0017673119|nr:DUF1642 domain-containing protein [Listeria seeligeri]HAB9782974.1 DUF1642 domain-containing protein [Listeria monocytogenes]HAB9788965.1 DUF1642 domain-containing protein [Listeria monocytogenes]HAB9987084.1 DUF1642 domain-containing protein [Listeria monocytogenes]HEL6782263.1 DUF1642 domain-containing protein [Listeria monocytogenes]HEL6789775.1 DUF1642 domain-containing protein [Listeria monocytogenes]